MSAPISEKLLGVWDRPAVVAFAAKLAISDSMLNSLRIVQTQRQVHTRCVWGTPLLVYGL